MASGTVYLDVDDEITSAAQRIRGSEATKLALVVPYGSPAPPAARKHRAPLPQRAPAPAGLAAAATVVPPPAAVAIPPSAEPTTPPEVEAATVVPAPRKRGKK